MSRPFKPIALLAVLTAFAGQPLSRAADNVLPDIGSSAGEIMSPELQHQYGGAMLHEMRGQGLVLDDPLLLEYLNSLGFQLVATSAKPDQPFTFFLVRENVINAFAAPGGYIGVNAGLIVTTQTESELAAVLAHEIAHITQQHLIRAFEDAQKSSIPIALAMLGAVIASRGRSDDAAPAALMTGVSLMQQRQINFTRQDETEADRLGIQTLARAHFEPDAMAGFFSRMQRALRPAGGDGEAPELLRTHPVTIQRISDAKSRAEGIKKDPQLRAATLPVGATASPLSLLPGSRLANAAPAAFPDAAERSRADQHYELMRERVRVLSARTSNEMVVYYSENLRDNPGFNTPANRYGYALALIQGNAAGQALPVAQKLLAGDPGNRVFQLLAAQAEFVSGDIAGALRRYAQMEIDFPRYHPLAIDHADTLLHQGSTADSRKALDLLRPQLENNSDDPELQTVFARACEISGDKIRAGQAHAEAALLNGHFEDAMNLLKTLSKRSDLDYYQRARVDARIIELTPVVLELRRRHIKPGDQGDQGTHGAHATALSCPISSACAPL
jgi:beta-barrel assembly-enhancing protease